MKIDRIQNNCTLTVTRVEKSIRIAFDLGHDIVLIFDARDGELSLICPLLFSIGLAENLIVATHGYIALADTIGIFIMVKVK
jgi:hypothetical protein